MPRKSQHSALARMVELLKCLPTRGVGLTAREIADVLTQNGFETTKRTVERDLQELSTMFPLTCNDRSRPFGWRWMEGEGAGLPGISLPEAVSLRIAEDLLRPLLPSAMLVSLEPLFNQAERKLEALAKENAGARWVDKVRHVPPALPLLPPKIAEGVLETVQDALLDDRQIEIQYRRPGEEATIDLALHPLGLVQRGPVTYLVATAFDYTDVRLYAVHRIVAAMKTDQPARRPKGFSLDDYIAAGALQFGGGRMIRLKALVSEDLAAILAETPLSGDQKLVEEGERYVLTASVADTPQLRWWILSWADHVTVLMPKKLRSDVARGHDLALIQYQPSEMLKK